MASHNEYGNLGEEAAVNYLRAKGYIILDRHWRTGHKEVDIVAETEGTLVFVEVKARRSDRYGDAVEAVTDEKIHKLIQAANVYVRYHRIDLPVRFDIITITGEPGSQTVEHFEDAFHSPLY